MLNVNVLLLILFSQFTYAADPIVTESTTDSTVTTNGSMTTTINQPPPSAISPQFSSGSNSDLCTIGVAGAVQTQILGISAGTTFTEEDVRESIQSAEERFENKRDALQNDYDRKASDLRDRTDQKIQDVEDRLNKKLQRALDNPLAN